MDKYRNPLSQYKVVSTLSDSANGKVYLATLESENAKQQKVVLKKIPGWSSSVEREIRAGKALGQHPNIVQLIDSFKFDGHTYIVSEYVSGSDLFEWLARRDFAPMNEGTAKWVFRQLISAVKYCHNNCIAHLDLKLENVIFDEKRKRVKLIDFGLSERICEESQRWCGTREYACPEVLYQVPYSTAKADVWCLGALLYVLLYGVVPFDFEQRRRHVNHNKPHPPLLFADEVYSNWDSIPSDSAKDLIRKMLEIDQDNRITLDEVIQHPWLKTGNVFFDLYNRFMH